MAPDPPQPDRYHRQRILPQIGADGQSRLASARVLLVGCGALGCTIADLLTRAGVGSLRIVDRDLVELTNLQRQSLFDEQDASQELPKSIAAANRLRQINSKIEIEPIIADLNAGNIEALAQCDNPDQTVQLILDGTDNVATRYLINDLSVKHGIPWIYGACVGTTGRVMGIQPGKTACLRCIFPDAPNANDLPTCDTAGVLSPAAAAVGALQAAIALRFLVEQPSENVSSPGLLTLDVWSTDFRTLPSAAVPQPDCPCCGHRNFPFLSMASDDFTTTLCGRNAVQVIRDRRGATLDLKLTAEKWRTIGNVEQSPWFLRCALYDPKGYSLTLFPDGRLLVHGTTEPLRARSLYARFVGT